MSVITAHSQPSATLSQSLSRDICCTSLVQGYFACKLLVVIITSRHGKLQSPEIG